MIPSEQSHIYVAATTHPGMSGKNNEDNYAVSAHHLSQSDSTPSVLAVLADGVGGHQAGEVAAEIATETISQIVLDSDGSDPIATLEYAFIQANQKVAHHSNSDGERQGMGSTCSCVWIIDDRLHTASVGDSRIYFIRNGTIRQITTDHTWVQEAIEHSIITPEQARNHPRAHVIRRYLGSSKPVEPDFRLRLQPDETDEMAVGNQGFKLLPEDQLLLCSDGLTDLVDDGEILEKMKTKKLERAIQALVDTANARGGHDNITIIALQIPPNNSHGKSKQLPGKSRGIKLSWQIYLAIAVLVVVAIASGIILYLYASKPQAKFTATPTIAITETITETETIVEEEQVQETVTEEILPTITPSLPPSETPILDTLTPWPTNTHTPGP